MPQGIDSKEVLEKEYGYPHSSELVFLNATDIDAYNKFLNFLENREKQIMDKITKHMSI